VLKRVVVLVAMAAWPAVAQEGRFDAQAFRPLGAPQDVVGVGQSRALSPSSVSAGAFLHFALDPLVLKAHGSEVKALSVVGPRLQLDMLATVGVAEGVEAGLTVPLVLAQGSDNLEALGSEGRVRSFALGDVRLRGKVAVPGLRRRAEAAGWGAALTLGVGLPTGSREAFAGEGALTWTPGALVDYRFDSGALLALDAGLWLRPSHEFLGVRWGNAATLGLGAEVPVLRGLGVTAVGTLTGSTPLATQPGLARQAPVEGLVVHLGRTGPVHLDYTESLDSEVYTTEELLLELLVGLTPGAGEVTEAHAAYSGRSLTGHALGDTERVLCAVGVVLPLVNGKVLKEAGEAGLQRFALLTGRSLEVQVLSRVAAHLSPEEAREVERLMAAAARGHTFTEQELAFLQRVARGLEAPLREAAEALKAGQKLPLLGARTLADGSRLLPGSPAHKAQRWLDYQFRHPEKYRHFSFQPDADWARMYDTILKNRPAGNAFEDAILQTGNYERNTAMMMPPPGSGAQGFMPDSVKGNPVELVWGQPYPFVEAKARKELSLSGNLKAMLEYVEKNGGHLELWVRSAMHPDGPTMLSGPLRRRLGVLMEQGKATLRQHPY